MYYDLNKKEYIKTEASKSLKFLYNTVIGRIILKIAILKPISKLYAKFLNSKYSVKMIDKFIKKNNINMNDYVKKDYKSFNEFFVRDLKKGKRKISEGLISVSDSKLSVYDISDDTTLKIKDSIYTIEELIGEKKKYKKALIFRLTADDYHHYIYPDDGKVIRTKHINGKLHTVQAIAQKRYKIFHENDREITFLECKNLKEVCYIEVGALLVGKIVNEKKKEFKKGEEKGHFEFGGSTIILLINSDIDIDKKIIENSNKDIETIVKLGDKIGK